MAISYPVDVQNTRWSAYEVSSGTITKHNREWPRADGSELEGDDGTIIPLLEVNEDPPVYDADTHKAEEYVPVVDINANTHTHGWDIVPLSQVELDAKAQSILDAQERAIALAMFQDLKNGVGTQLERLVRAEKVAAHLLKEKYNNP